MGGVIAKGPVERRDYFIQGPDGGDCESLPFGGTKTWEAQTAFSSTGEIITFGTCTIEVMQVGQGESLTIRRYATLAVRGQLTNSGFITIRAGDPFGTAALRLEGFAFFQNQGFVAISPHRDFASPGLENRSANSIGIHNFGRIESFSVPLGNNEILGGIINNFGTIKNQGELTNRGFLHNSGPPVQARRARVDNVDGGILRNESGAFLENMGEITGTFINSGTCTFGC
jgi:hypothetical protein